MKHKDSADVVLFASPVELAEMNPPRRKRKTLEHPVLDSFEYDSFLVKTALIRAEDWDPTKQTKIRDSHGVYQIVKHIVHYDQEHMVSLAITNAGNLAALHESAIGGPSSVDVAVKTLVKVALLTNCSGVILVHNHPSGSSAPSGEDTVFTRQAAKDLECFGLQLLDHVIVATDGYFSFADKGFI